MKDHRSQKKADAFSTTVDSAGQTSGLAGKMEIEIQSQQMFKYIRSHFSYGLLGNASEDRVAEFLEQCGPNPCDTI